MLIFKDTKNLGFNLRLEDAFFEKSQGRVKLTALYAMDNIGHQSNQGEY